MKLIKSILFILIILLFIKVDFRLQDKVYCCGDDHDYYSHSETLAIDFDFDYSNQLEGFEEARYHKGGKIAPIGFFGSGLLASPFLFIGNIFDQLVNNTTQISYKLLFYSFSPIFYMYLALKYLFKIKVLVNSKLSNISILLLFLGSGVSYYAFERFSMTHIYEVFTITLISYFSIIIHKNSKKRDIQKYSFLLVFFLFLGFNVRWVNYFIFIIPYYLPRLFELKKHNLLKLKIIYFFASIFGLLTLLINKLIYGIYTLNPNDIYESDIVGSALTNLISIDNLIHYIRSFIIILFTKEFGIFFFSPAVFCGLLVSIYLFVKKPKKKLNLLGIIINFQVFAIVVIWQSTASSYGFRYLICLVPISIILIMKYLEVNKSLNYKYFTNFLLALSVFSFLSTLFFETTLLTQLSTDQQINSFGKSVRYTQPEYLEGYLKAFTSFNAYLKIFVTSFLGMIFFKFLFMFVDVETFLTFISNLGFNFTDDKVINLLIEYSDISWIYLSFVIFLTSLFVNKLINRIITNA